VFDSSFGSPKQTLSLIRAKEVAQALLAEAICKARADAAPTLMFETIDMGPSEGEQTQVVRKAEEVGHSRKSVSISLKQKG
jgi:hypothetical protein